MPFFSGLVGALTGAFLALAFNMWKFHRDERNARCDELCKAIWDLGLLASEYWAKQYNAPYVEQALMEAKILSTQNLVDGLYADFRDYMPMAAHAELDEYLSSLLDAVTGGEFSVEGRTPDAARLLQAPQTGSGAIIGIRRYHRQSIPLHSVFKAFHANRHRELDMPTPIEQRL